MDPTVIAALTVDGMTNGAIYALMAIALVLVFSVTRVILIPQGALVAFAALTYGYLERGAVPGTSRLLLVLGAMCFLATVLRAGRRLTARKAVRAALLCLIYPVLVFGLTRWVAPSRPGLELRVLLTALLIVPIGSYVYHLAFAPLQKASVLILLMAAMGVHIALTVMGLIFFGPDGLDAQPFSDESFSVAGSEVSVQSLIVVVVPLVLMVALWLFFERSLQGKALRAVAVNRVGAQLVGVPIARAGHVAFTLAAVIGTVSGILLAPLSLVYYDTGFLVGLKGFVAAAMGGLVAYPPVVAGAFLIGLLQSFGSFWSSAYTDVVVFMMLFPILVWRSLKAGIVEDDE